MRVISGSRKGHKLKSPKGLYTRPTSDKIKESLFNILGNIASESMVLDLFSGSGSIGIEFLSRGATSCYFIDNRLDSINIIKENLLHTKLYEFAVVLKDDALRALRDLKKNTIRFDYIFLDPPFKDRDLLFTVIEFISNYKILFDTGLLIVEHDSSIEPNDNLYNFIKVKSKNYGKETISFYKCSSRR